MHARRSRVLTLVGACIVMVLVIGAVRVNRSSAPASPTDPAVAASVPETDGSEPGLMSTSVDTDPFANDAAAQSPASASASSSVFVAPQVEAEIEAQGSTTVIVRLDAMLAGTDAERRETAQASADQLLSSLPAGSAEQIGEVGTVPVVAMTVDADGLAALRDSELVDSVAANERKVPTSMTSSTFIGARSAWSSGFTGAGSTVAVLDSGVQTDHPFLMNGAVPKTVAEACFSTGGGGYVSTCPSTNPQVGPGSAVPCSVSTCKHGTHVAGIAVGGNAGPGNPQGVAPGATLIAVQVFGIGCSGTCIGASDLDLNAAMQWLYDNRASYPGLTSVNMSLGGTTKYTSYCNNDAEQPFIAQLRSVGIATVVASGNSGWRDGVASPGCIEDAVTVGAQDDAGAALGQPVAVASYSNIGPQVDFLAPGSSIYSSVPVSGYAYLSGTSMATPAVAGAFALMREATLCDPTAQLRNDTDFTTIASFSIPGLRLDKAVRGTPCQPRSVTAYRGAGNVQVSWNTPLHPGTSAITGYEVEAQPGGARCTTSGALTCTLANPSPGYVHTYTVRARNAAGLGAGTSIPDGGTQFTPVSPERILDTRPGETTADNLYAGGGAIGPDSTRTTPVTGRPGLPSPIPADAVAVVLNVTVDQPTAWSNLRAFPAGTPIPEASNLNYTAGQTVPNLVVVKLGTGGAVSLYNVAGYAHVIVDVMGYYRDTVGSKYTAMSPARFLDTRSGYPTIDGQYSGGGRIGAGGTLDVQIAGRDGVPANAVAVVVNVTVAEPTAWSNLRAFPAGTPRPTASNLNYSAGQTVPNLVVVKLGAGGAISLYNVAGTTQVVADVMGYFSPGSATMFSPLVPARFLDTRPGYPTIDGRSSGVGRIGAGGTLNVQIAGRAGVPLDATAVVVNVTVTEPTAWSNLRAFPAGTARPDASNLNYSAGQTVPNSIVVKLGAGGAISLYNVAGTTHAIVDVMGFYR